MKHSEKKILILGLGLTLLLPTVLPYVLTENKALIFLIVSGLLGSLVGVTSYNQILGKQETKTDNFSARPRDMPSLAKRLLKLILSTNTDQDNIIGDLLEEYLQFNSKLKAYAWLYKQLLKSALPLIWQNVKTRLAARFGARIR